MKKNIIYYLFIVVLFSSCTKQELKMERPDEKLFRVHQEYMDMLTKAESGWVGYLFPKGGRGFTFRFVFTENNRVRTSANLDERYTVEEMESSFRVVADQTPSLSFDTYTYLHLLSDPDEFVFGGARGQGHYSDFEFSFMKVSKDTIQLKGNHNGSTLLLIRASLGQDVNFIRNSYALNRKMQEINDFPKYHKKVTINNTDFTFTISPHINSIAFYHQEGGTFKQTMGIYTANDYGIRFKEPVELAGEVFNEITDFKVDARNNQGSFVINNKEIKITALDAPLYIDRLAPTRFRELPKQFHSRHMFTIDGVHDAIGLRGLEDFIGGFYLSNVNQTRHDAMYLVYRTGSRYVGPLFFTHIEEQSGIMKHIKDIEAYGYNPGPEGIIILRRFNDQWFDEAGFYVFQTGPTDYDLVNAKNGNIWVRFN